MDATVPTKTVSSIPIYTPQYLFTNCYKFAYYLEKATQIMKDYGCDETLSAPGVCWWFDGKFYTIAFYFTESTVGKMDTSIVTKEIFSTRFQRDALTACLFFYKLYNLPSSPREGWRPNGVSHGGWATKIHEPSSVKREASTAMSTINNTTTPERLNKYGKPTLLANMALHDMRVALFEYCGGNLNYDYLTKYSIVAVYTKWLNKIELEEHIAIEGLENHLNYINGLTVQPMEKFCAQLLFHAECMYIKLAKSLTETPNETIINVNPVTM